MFRLKYFNQCSHSLEEMLVLGEVLSVELEGDLRLTFGAKTFGLYRGGCCLYGRRWLDLKRRDGQGVFCVGLGVACESAEVPDVANR